MQEHEARSRTRGDRLGVTDTPVCEQFHGQRLWSPYSCIDDLVAVAVETAVGVGVAGSVGAAGAGAGAAGAAGTVTVIAR